MLVSGERTDALRKQLREFYQAMGFEVSMPESINGFSRTQTVAYRLRPNDPPLQRAIQFFIRLQSEDPNLEGITSVTTYAVFANLEPGSENEDLHVVATTDLSHA